MILFQRNNIEIEYHPAEKIMEVRWIGDLGTYEFDIMWQQVRELVNQHQAAAILLDATHSEVMPRGTRYDPSIQQFFTKKLAIPTVKKIARISPIDVEFKQDITNLYFELNKNNPSAFEFKNFNYYYEALNWILHHNNH